MIPLKDILIIIEELMISNNKKYICILKGKLNKFSKWRKVRQQ